MPRHSSANQARNHSADSPKVSVIMNCLNCEKYLKEAIDSVYAQTYQNWDIIFWDNASTDSSAEIVKTYDERLQYFRGQETVPLGHARNLAIERAKGMYIAFLDCDDIWLPEKLEKQISLFAKHPELGLVYSNCLRLYLPSNRHEEVFWTVRAHRGDVLEKLFMENFIPMPTVVAKKDILVKSGGFVENLKVSPDLDMWLRITERAPVDYIDETLAIYRIHDKSFTLRNQALSPLEDMIVLKKCIERNLNLRLTLGKRVSKKFSELYIFLAVIYLKGNEIRNSFGMLLRAFRLYPMNLWYPLHLILHFIKRRWLSTRIAKNIA
jgi:glycosyltransferase involved in cell wall biosynthesis